MSQIRQVNIVKKFLENHLIKKAQENQIKSSYYIKQNLSPSTDFVCQKKAYYNIVLNGIVDSQQNDNFSYENETAKMVGSDFHNRFQKLLLDTGIRRLNETTLEDKEHKIRGRIDSLIEINGEFYLAELKSAKSYAMKIMSDENAPNIEHLKQLNICFFLLEVNSDLPEVASVLQGRAVNKGLIIYESKNDHKTIEFLVNKDQTIIDEMLRYSDFVWKHVSIRREPKTPFEPDAYECSYCPYYEKCHGPKKPEVKFEEKDVWGSVHAKEVSKEPKF